MDVRPREALYHAEVHSYYNKRQETCYPTRDAESVREDKEPDETLAGSGYNQTPKRRLTVQPTREATLQGKEAYPTCMASYVHVLSIYPKGPLVARLFPRPMVSSLSHGYHRGGLGLDTSQPAHRFRPACLNLARTCPAKTPTLVLGLSAYLHRPVSD